MKHILFYFFLILTSIRLIGQSSKITSCVTESVVLSIDRNIYVKGETVMFSAVVLINGNYSKHSLSKVLYIQLYNEYNESLLTKKIEIKENRACTQIVLPESCSTTRYIVRAYTQYMKNQTSSTFAEIPIFVIDPKVQLKYHAVNLNGNESSYQIVNSPNLSNIDITYNTDSNIDFIDIKSNEYSTRERVVFSIDKDIVNNRLVNINVVKHGTNLFVSNVKSKMNIEQKQTEVLFAPEVVDLSLSGIVLSSTNKSPIADEIVVLSLLGDNPQIHFSKTGKDGKFRMVLNQVVGTYKVGLTMKNVRSGVDILIDNKFCTEYNEVFDNPIHIDSTQQRLIQDLLANHRVTSRFFEGRVEKPKSVQGFNLLTPDYYKAMDDFIKLDNLEEFFFEILPIVHVKKTEDRVLLEVYGDGYVVQDENPLVLVDYLPITDMKELLKLRLDDIKELSLYNKYYLLGDYGIRSLLSITTKTDNFGGLKLPEDLVFFDFATIDKFDNMSHTRIDSTRLSSSLPYFNTSLFWSPYLPINDSGQYSFYTSDHLSSYDIIVSLLDKDGGIEKKTITIEVVDP